MEKSLAIGIDVGGTNMPTSLIDSDGKILKTVNKKTKLEPDDLISNLNQSIEEIKSEFKNSKIEAIGLGMPGVLDIENGIVLASPNLSKFKKVPVVEKLQKLSGISVFMNNDANLAALAEHWIGAAKGAKNSIMLTLGTGVGSGIIIDDKMYLGSHGMAGEIGHMTIIEDGLDCSCGNKGCLEAYASANATVKRSKARLKESKDSMLNNYKNITAKDIFTSAKASDSLSIELLKESGRFLGIGLANVSNIFDPDVIVIGGGFSEASDFILPEAIREMEKRALGPITKVLKIRKAKLSNNAGMIGAARMALLNSSTKS